MVMIKSIIAAFALVPAALALGDYSITAYTSTSCSNAAGATVETVSGTQQSGSTCVSFPGGRSLDLTMSGSCSTMTAYFSSDCTPGVGPSPDHTDSGSPWNVGCQTYALNAGQPMAYNSFKVIC